MTIATVPRKNVTTWKVTRKRTLGPSYTFVRPRQPLIIRSKYVVAFCAVLQRILCRKFRLSTRIRWTMPRKTLFVLFSSLSASEHKGVVTVGFKNRISSKNVNVSENENCSLRGIMTPNTRPSDSNSRPTTSSRRSRQQSTRETHGRRCARVEYTYMYVLWLNYKTRLYCFFYRSVYGTITRKRTFAALIDHVSCFFFFTFKWYTRGKKKNTHTHV